MMDLLQLLQIKIKNLLLEDSGNGNHFLNEEETQPTVKFSDIVEHIFNQPSLDGIAPIVASLPQNLIDRLLWETNSNRETILHMATIKNNIECVRLFIELGNLYILKYDLKIISYLNIFLSFLLLGVDINAKDKNGWTVLHCACYEGLIDICLYLIRMRIPVMSLTSSRTIPLHYLVRSVKEETWIDSKLVLDNMLKEGVDVNAKDSYGKTPLHHVLLRGRNIQCIEYLIKNNANVNSKTV